MSGPTPRSCVISSSDCRSLDGVSWSCFATKRSSLGRPPAGKPRARRSTIVTRAAAADHFKGKNGAPSTLWRRPGLGRDTSGRRRLRQARRAQDRRTSSSSAAPRWARFRPRADRVTIIAELPGRRHEAGADRRPRARRAAARLCVRPLQDQEEGGRAKGPRQSSIDHRRRRSRRARKAWRARDGIADGVVLARDLVNEPANVLYPEEFARRATR